MDFNNITTVVGCRNNETDIEERELDLTLNHQPLNDTKKRLLYQFELPQSAASGQSKTSESAKKLLINSEKSNSVIHFRMKFNFH